MKNPCTKCLMLSSRVGVDPDVDSESDEEANLLPDQVVYVS